MPENKTKEHRKHLRYPMRWEVSVVFDESEGRPKLFGRTHEVSVEGISIVTDSNIYSTEPVTILLAIPPQHTGQRKIIVEARSRMRYTVHSSDHGKFRIGIHFQSFKGNGRALLQQYLSERTMIRDGLTKEA